MCVLEIKLGKEYVENPPQWIQELMDSDLLMECYKFSKYGESVNTFYQNKIHFIPRWRTENELNSKCINIEHEITTLTSEKEISKTKNVHNRNVNKSINVDKKEYGDSYGCDCCLGKLNKMCVRNDKKSYKKPVNPKVNPKVYFSNERTFLGWFQAAVFIGGSGLTIHSMNSEDIAGHLLICVAFMVLTWAIYIYYKRNFRLLRGSLEGLHDMYGPIILVFVICFVFAYSLISGKSNVAP